MKTLLKVLGWLVLGAVLMVAGAALYSTWKGYTTWYFRVNGRVMVDGHETTGYMHANTQRTILLLTRADGPRKETYLVPLGQGSTIFDCGEWHPVRFLPIAIGDLNPACSPFTDPAEVVDGPTDKTLVRGRRSIEFSTASGKKIKAEF